MQTLIIQWGRPLPEGLLESLNGEDVGVVRCNRLTPELVERLGRSDLAVFLETSPASAAADPAWERLDPDVTTPAFSHSLDPSTLLGAVRALYGACPESALLRATTDSFDQSLMDRLRRWIAQAQCVLRLRQVAGSFANLHAWAARDESPASGTN